MDRVPRSYFWLAPFSVAFVGVVLIAAQTSPVKFTPPTRLRQIAAIGSLQGLSPVLRRALDPANDFAPIPKPGDIDWLANFAEPGQTYSQFVQSQPRRPNARRNKLYLQPIGKYDESAGASLAMLRQFTSSFFMMDAAVLPPLDVSQSHIRTRTNFYTHRPQMLTGDILKLLYGRLPPDVFALLGITMTDLYPGPGWDYLFGQAAPRSAVGVYSFARYDPAFYGEARTPASRQLLLRRSCKVLAHEVSHMFGIQHCIWFRCTVNGCNHIDELDGAPLHLCPVDLRKLQWSAGFDVVERYRRLDDFYAQAGLRNEAEWLEKRLRVILAEPAGRRP